MQYKDYCQAMGVSRDASLADIKKAFLVAKHPDTADRIRRLQTQAEQAGHDIPSPRLADDRPLAFVDMVIRRLPSWQRGSLWISAG